MKKLWTKNFTIITLGSIISMLGNAVSGFAIGLLVLDMTGSPFLYALFMVIYSLPRIFSPMIAGPYMDRFSRKKTIYILDFISSILFALIFIVLKNDIFSFPIMLFFTLVIGCIDGVYTVAYESLYPNLISEGNYTKAYSISSMIYPLTSFMVPVAAIVYDKIGPSVLFLFDAFTFFIAACFETQIDYKEEHIKSEKENNFGFQQFKNDFKEGVKYIYSEKGLLIITIYFCITMFASGGAQVLYLPFFLNHSDLFSSINIDIKLIFTIVMGAGVLGRLIGGAIQYRYKYPINKKFTIALCVYTVITVLEGINLYLPFWLMQIGFFIVGIMGVTSYNIRISSTQAYVPDNKRGRFNGAFQMLCTAGGIFGQLLAGLLAEKIHERIIIIAFMAINMLAVIFVMYRGREHVKKIYNRQV